jgi:predicted dehydrogenase
MRCAIVGAGNIVEDIHLPALRAIKGVEVAALCDSDPQRASSFSKKYTIPAAYSSVDDLLNSNAHVQFVDIATPPHTHYELTRQCLSAGLHVIVEKPLALNSAEAHELDELARSRGQKLCVLQTYRFRGAVLQAFEAVHRGTLGKLRHVAITSRGDDPFQKRAVWGWPSAATKLLLYELAIHYVDLELQFAGPVRGVSGFRSLRDDLAGAVTEIYAIVNHESGVTATLDLQVKTASNYTRLELLGSSSDVLIELFPESFRLRRGQITPVTELQGDLSRLWDVAYPTLLERVRKPLVGRRAIPHYRVMQAFVESIEHPNLEPPVSAASVLPTLDLLDALHARL